MPHYLVTGGCGFIGSHLVDALLARGDSVVVLDDFSTGKRENIPQRVPVIKGDAADPALVEEAMQRVDGCFHLAAVASVQKSKEEWLATHRANQTATVAVLDTAAKQANTPKVVYASSAAVYGDNTQVPLGESAATGPQTAYGADKLGSELHARVAAQVHGVPTAGMRFFNVYGPRQDPHSPYSGVISIFAERIRRGNGITINGDGGQTRDFIYVGDVVRALLAAMAAESETAEVFNVCTGKETSIGRLAEILQQLAGKQVAISHGPARTGDIYRSLGDPAKAEKLLGFRAETPVEKGLQITLESLQRPGGKPEERASA